MDPLTETSRFPMQDGPSIDMVAARAIYQVYSCMHSGQSLAEIARRGGFSWREVGFLLQKHAEYKQRGNCTCAAIQKRDETDAAFILAGQKPEDRNCDHSAYRALKEPRPRHCPACGTCMWDAGD